MEIKKKQYFKRKTELRIIIITGGVSDLNIFKFLDQSGRSAEQTAAARQQQLQCKPLGQLTVKVKSTTGYSDSVLLFLPTS